MGRLPRRQLRPPLGSFGVVALPRFGGVPGVVEVGERPDHFDCSFVLAAKGGFEDFVGFQKRGLGVGVALQLCKALAM